MRISSRHNPIVGRFRAAARGDATGLVLLDGIHLIEEAAAAGVRIDTVALSAEAESRHDVATAAGRLAAAGATVVSVTAPVLDAISPVHTSTGMVALAERPAVDPARMFQATAPLVLVAADVQDPGNVGAIVRVAEAAGATGVVTTAASADPFGWKALRGSMGSAFRLPLARCPSVDAAAALARGSRCRIIATVPRGGRSLFDAPLAGPVAILIGGEGAGLPPAVVDGADERITIPMQRPVESLNAAVTAALVAYEARRQRTTS